MKVIALIRVSTDKQSESGLGLEAQTSAIEAFCARQGFVLVATHTESGVSGKTALTGRSGLMAALADVRLQEAGALVVASLDRCSRDPLILMTIEKALASTGARLVSTKGEGTESDDPSQVLLRRILAAVAENEAALVSLRTSSAMKAKAARGEFIGRPPFGFCVQDGDLVPNNEFQFVVQVLRLRSRKESFRAIAETMESAAPGLAWSAVKAQRIVSRWRSIRTLNKRFPNAPI